MQRIVAESISTLKRPENNMEAGVDNMAFIPMKDTEEQECRFLVTNLIKTDP